jgi:hypothetical protein
MPTPYPVLSELDSATGGHFFVDRLTTTSTHSIVFARVFLCFFFVPTLDDVTAHRTNGLGQCRRLYDQGT